jgi:predicted TIM-barrel fold metal-dependent hydrolase/nitrite reductase/ring-hydroxylating ferredoxin subunit
MKVVVGKVSDFGNGDRRIIDVNGKSIGVFRIDDRFYAIRNRCPHQFGPLCLGTLAQRAVSDGPGDMRMDDGPPLIACPWHGWEYDLATGQSFMGPGDAGVGRAGLRGRRGLARPPGQAGQRGQPRERGADMTATVPETTPRERDRARTLLIDVDVHPLFLARDILPRLPEPWRTRYANEQTGRKARVVRDYPRWRNGGFRIDAAVPGGAPGSDLGVLRGQLLEEYDTDIAILIPLTFVLEGPAAYKAALCRAINDWLAEEWLDRDPRFRGSLNVPFDSPDLAVAEIERFAGDPRFVQVMVRGDNQSEWGDRKYWPIYQACEAAGFVAMCHVGGPPGNGYRGSGAPSYYLEQHVWLHMPVERLAMSMICEGVFDEYPGLQVALVEACLTWSGPLQWAMDAAYEVAGNDAPRLRRLPSEYFREHFWLSTQPVEEPENPRHLVQSIEFARIPAGMAGGRALAGESKSQCG